METGWIIALSVLCLLLGGVAGGAIFSKTEVIEKEVPVIVTNTIVDNSTNDEITHLYNEATEDDRQEAMAEELALSELNTKDFKKELVSLLTDVESYKDITKVVVKDTDVDLNKEDAVVEFDLKVYYFIDGDEEETEKARFTAVFDVSELVDEDSYEDSEALLNTLTLVKVY